MNIAYLTAGKKVRHVQDCKQLLLQDISKICFWTYLSLSARYFDTRVWAKAETARSTPKTTDQM
jgi:hypothetical protein